MYVSINTQSYIFLYSVIGGMLIAFIYDIFRIKRKAIKTSSIVIYIEDFIYWIIVSLVMFAVFYYSNEGEIRGYIFIGTAIGVVLYISLFSRIIIKSSMLIIGIISKIFRAIWFVLSYPFKILYKILCIPCTFIFSRLKKLLRSTRRMGRNRFARAAIWRKIFKNFRKKI